MRIDGSLYLEVGVPEKIGESVGEPLGERMFVDSNGCDRRNRPLSPTHRSGAPWFKGTGEEGQDEEEEK